MTHEVEVIRGDRARWWACSCGWTSIAVPYGLNLGADGARHVKEAAARAAQ